MLAPALLDLPVIGGVLAAALAVVVAVFKHVSRSGADRRDREALQKEVRDAQDIRERVDDARRDHDDGVRPYERHGWRD